MSWNCFWIGHLDSVTADPAVSPRVHLELGRKREVRLQTAASNLLSSWTEQHFAAGDCICCIFILAQVITEREKMLRCSKQQLQITLPCVFSTKRLQVGGSRELSLLNDRVQISCPVLPKDLCSPGKSEQKCRTDPTLEDSCWVGHMRRAFKLWLNSILGVISLGISPVI